MTASEDYRHRHDPDGHGRRPPTVLRPILLRDTGAGVADDTLRALEDVAEERRRQFLLWPTAHDDRHGLDEWLALVLDQLSGAVLGGPVWRKSRLVKAAAVLVAAIEAYDRRLGMVRETGEAP